MNSNLARVAPEMLTMLAALVAASTCSDPLPPPIGGMLERHRIGVAALANEQIVALHVRDRVKQLLPLTHFIEVVRGVILRGATLVSQCRPMPKLTAFLLAAVLLATLRFRKRLD